ncbi:DUF3263 domain-containing protein [Rhodococcus jostii]|uniref:DUF3263 domain-containing protein n=1 Tax=Rhodococcus jostii TaxID=132919 RepID=A0ABU4CTP8_RHOJO|nr:DUF3263 domain-containing protein [Rhodococcus jostii]MDV6286935.1 DUF3263 domain-containing protein [Rhodococcus jostii]
MMNDSIIEDAQILEFARRWLPYGGGNSGDLLVEFGMTPACYVARLGKILDGLAARHLEPHVRIRLREFIANYAHRAR